MPVALTYDNMPPKSRLRREVSEDGSVTISAPAGVVGELSRRAAMQATAWTSAAKSILILAVITSFFLALSDRQQSARLTPAMLNLLCVASGVGFVSLFLLIWRDRYGRVLTELESTSRQLCTVNLSTRGMIIETAGPWEHQSRAISTPVEWRIARLRQTSLLAIHIRMGDDVWCRIFPGLSRAELAWVGNEIERIAGHLTAADERGDVAEHARV